MEGERLTKPWVFASCGAGAPGLYSPSPGAYICQVVSRQYPQARQREAGRGQSRGCGACVKGRVAVTCHTEFLAHRCYGDIWPAGGSWSVFTKYAAAKRSRQTRGRDAAGVGSPSSPWLSRRRRRRCPICPAGSWSRALRRARRSGGSSRRSLSPELDYHMGRDCHRDCGFSQ